MNPPEDENMRMAKTIAIAALAIALGGCAAGNMRENMGSGIGAVTGGVIFNQIGKGRGKVLATAAGAVVGALVGGAIGRHLDEAAQAEMTRATTQALNTGVIGGGAIAWETPATSSTPAKGQIEITRQGQSANGRLCREYRQQVTIGADTEEIIGTACRDAGGVWKIMES